MIRCFLFLLTLFILLPLTLRAQTDSVVQAPRSMYSLAVRPSSLP